MSGWQTHWQSVWEELVRCLVSSPFKVTAHQPNSHESDVIGSSVSKPKPEALYYSQWDWPRGLGLGGKVQIDRCLLVACKGELGILNVSSLSLGMVTMTTQGPLVWSAAFPAGFLSTALCWVQGQLFCDVEQQAISSWCGPGHISAALCFTQINCQAESPSLRTAVSNKSNPNHLCF